MKDIEKYSCDEEKMLTYCSKNNKHTYIYDCCVMFGHIQEDMDFHAYDLTTD